MNICTQPLDGILAFLGALGFLGALVAIPMSAAFEWSSNAGEKIWNPQHESTYPVTVFVLFVTVALLVLVVILAFVNQALPPICHVYG